MEDYITRSEHEEFCKRMEDEHKRLNNRMKIQEEDVRQINTLTTSVHELAVNMENMIKSLNQQGERLEALEGRDGEKWRAAAGYIVTAIIGIIIGYIFKQVGM